HHRLPLCHDPCGQPPRHERRQAPRQAQALIRTPAIFGPPASPGGLFLRMTTTAALHVHFLASTGVCTDTRRITPGCLFMALKGPRFNANAFAAQALEQGARMVVVDDPTVAVDGRYVLVPDVLTALQDLARHHRRGFDLPVLAITGTNGKTTTKELVSAVLAAHAPTLATEGNLNNEIGVPLTLLRLTAAHRYA